MTVLFIVYHSVKRLSISFLQCAVELELSHWGLASCPWRNWAEDNVGEQELSYQGAERLPAKSQRCKQAGRRWGGLLQCQHSMRLLQVLCSCSPACKLPPRRLAETRGAPSVNVTMETPAHVLLWSIRVHLDGDPSARSALVWRLFQHTWNRQWCCRSALSLHPAVLTGENFRAQHKILFLTCGKAAVISLGDSLIFNLVCLDPLWTVQFPAIRICTVAVLLMLQEQ